MSMHRSLKTHPFENRHRSVRKRYERLRSLKLQHKWDEEHNKIFALPKEKRLKHKEKKEKEAEKILTPMVTTLPTEKKKIKKKSKDITGVR